jgi:hypothetical protein
MRILFLIVRCRLLLTTCMLIGCGGARGKGEADPLVLLAKGSYAEARSAVFKKTSITAKDRAIVALSFVAEKPGGSAGKEAVGALSEEADDIGAAASAVEMLDLAFEIPQPVAYEVAFVLAEAALGALGQGPLAGSAGRETNAGELGRSLSIAILERVFLALIPIEAEIKPDRLLKIWNGCFILSGGSTEMEDEVQAWRLFKSVGGLAVLMNKAAPDSNLTDVLLTAAVNTVESNPDIAIPARCDLSSPFDDLKFALAHNRELLGRLETAVAAAMGCTRGTYAPETK